MKIIGEFKKFAIRGNVMDLAIGVIIGGAFNTIVTSLVNDIIMPPIGYLTGGIKFDHYKIILKPEVVNAGGRVVQEAVTFNYGNFIQVLVNFLVIAFSMFMVVKMINKVREKQEKNKMKEAVPLPEEIALLREIRDALKKKI